MFSQATEVNQAHTQKFIIIVSSSSCCVWFCCWSICLSPSMFGRGRAGSTWMTQSAGRRCLKMLFHSLQEARNRQKIADNCRETLSEALLLLLVVPVVSLYLCCFPEYCRLPLSLTEGCLHGSERRTLTHKHSNTHYVPVLLLKTGFHGEAGWESFRGIVCIHTCVLLCASIAQTVNVLYAVAALFSVNGSLASATK